MALYRFNLAKYRIIRRESFVEPGMPIFEVEQRDSLWWEPRGIFTSLAEAESRVAALRTATGIKRQVIKKYD